MSETVPPVERSIRLLRYISSGKPVSNRSEAARALEINRTTLNRLLTTLEGERFIEPLQNGEFHIGTGLIALASERLFSADVVTISAPLLTKMAHDLGLSCHLGMLEGADVLYILRQTPNVLLVSNIRVGSKLPAYATTMGRILLSYLADDELENRFQHHIFTQFTSKTATSFHDLKLALTRDKLQGFSESESAYEAGIDSIAAPVFDASGKAIAAINVSGPEVNFRQTRDFIRQTVIETAANISLRLGYTTKRSM
jgi:DNA-binding IclR family transcriptional regulator